MGKLTYPARRASYRARMALGALIGPPEAELACRLKDRLAGRRLVFCLTNGRSGSNLLADLLALVPCIDARHEAAPWFDMLRREAALDPRLARAFLLRIKLPAIAGTRALVHAETSHLFGKGFFRPMLATGIPFDCIVLRRDPRKVALSMLSLGHLPGGPRPARRFLIAPDEAECLPLPDPGALTPYQLLYWHVLESEARAAVYAAELRRQGGRVAETALEELSAPGRFKELLSALEIDPAGIDEAALRRRLARPVNEKRHKRRSVDIPEDELDRQESELRRVLAPTLRGAA